MSADSPKLRHVRIVGSGLIGTSIGLALRKNGIQVTMIDKSSSAQSLARDLMGETGSSPSKTLPVDLVLIATPSSAITEVIEGEIASNLDATFMDVASIKAKPSLDVSRSVLPSSRFLPSHPMAGREVGGAESARSDLFQGCIWAFDPTGVEPDSLYLGLELISACGATPLSISAEDHDRAVAIASHLPQMISTLLARQLESTSSSYLDLAGGGLRDTTRIAASSPALWSEILSQNSQALRPLLEKVLADLTEVTANLENRDYLFDFVQGGNRGRARIPGKHGGLSRYYTYLPVVIEDKPGQLAALFDQCAAAEVNIEDLSIEHSPEQFTGLITLALSEVDARKLFAHLEAAGWKVHEPR